MNRKFKYVTLAVIIIICQILVSEYVNIWPILYIAIFTQFITILPTATNRFAFLGIAFAMGLSIDLFADGVMGLNAAALTAMAYFRHPILKFVLTRANLDNYDSSPISSGNVEIPKLVLINAMMLTVFFTVYVLLDSAASFSWWYTLLKIAVCVAANTLISIFVDIVLLKKILR